MKKATRGGVIRAGAYLRAREAERRHLAELAQAVIEACRSMGREPRVSVEAALEAHLASLA
jgi:hypothetical protein